MQASIPQRVNEESQTPIAELGEEVRQYNPDTGQVGTYLYCYANAAITQYDACKIAATESGDCDVAAASLKQVIDATKSWTVNAYKDWFVAITDGAAPAGETLKVKSNIATKLNLKGRRPGGTDSFSAAQATTHRYCIFNPYAVTKTTAVLDSIKGISPIAVTSGYYFWLLVKGITLVNCSGSTGDTTVSDEPVVPAAADGFVEGYTAGGTTADEAATPGHVIALETQAIDGLCMVEII